jgi:hypothetical protein
MTTFNNLVLNFAANALWQTAFVLALAALGQRTLLRSVSAQYRHSVWVAALIWKDDDCLKNHWPPSLPKMQATFNPHS